MRVEPYRSCLTCGRPLETPSQYRRHAHCADCGVPMAVK